MRLVIKEMTNKQHSLHVMEQSQRIQTPVQIVSKPPVPN